MFARRNRVRTLRHLGPRDLVDDSLPAGDAPPLAQVTPQRRTAPVLGTVVCSPSDAHVREHARRGEPRSVAQASAAVSGLAAVWPDPGEDLLGGSLVPRDDAADAERVRRIATEATETFRLLSRVRRGVSMFGSARERPAERWGALAREVAAALTEAGFTVITGGGPGLMAAASDGALQARGPSVGLTIHLPHDEPANPSLTLQVPFHYFFLRKLAFVKYSCAFVILPGGYGTLDELFEALNLRRTHRLDPFPIILVGASFWSGLVEWLRTEAVRTGVLDQEDVASLLVTDDPAVVTREVVACHRALCHRLGIDP